MDITLLSSESVKPASDHCRSRKVDSPPYRNSDTIPLSVFDKVNYTEYVAGIYAFHPPTRSNAALEAGLSNVLSEYPHWAGRLAVDDASSNRSILLNGAGVRFVEATAAVALSSVMPLEMGPESLRLFPYDGDATEELLLVQLTRFACGSLVVGYNHHHSISDGTAISSFLLAWGQATRGVPINPKPVHDRAAFFAPRDPPRVEFEHRGVEFRPNLPKQGHNNGVIDASDDIVIHMVYFSPEAIMMLKSRASADTTRKCTTLQCVAAYLWQCITKARGLEPGKTTKMHISLNGRARMSCPRVPWAYTGNVVLWAWPATTVQDLVDRPLGYAVELISKKVGRIDDNYFRSFIDFASSGAVEREQLVPTADSAEITLSPNVEVDCLLGMPWYDLDFGSGKPFFFMPCHSKMPVDGVIYIVPSFTGDGGVDAYVPLFSRHMGAFKKHCYAQLPVENARL